MPRQTIPLIADDLSRFTRALAHQLGEAAAPSHLSLMNMVARAAGFRNVQHLQAAHRARERLAAPRAAAMTESLDHRRVERALVQFDAAGRLARWPARRGVQDLCLWTLWSVLPADEDLPEQAVNRLLGTEHLFDDPATLRRSLLGLRILTRDRAGTAYRRLEERPPAEARALIRLVAERRRHRA